MLICFKRFPLHCSGGAFNLFIYFFVCGRGARKHESSICAECVPAAKRQKNHLMEEEAGTMGLFYSL